MNTICDQPGCPDPRGDIHGHHYHCGRCDSPQITSMYGHLRNGRWRCDPADSRAAGGDA